MLRDDSYILLHYNEDENEQKRILFQKWNNGDSSVAYHVYIKVMHNIDRLSLRMSRELVRGVELRYT